MTMTKRAVQHWIHGLVSAFIGGGASAVTASFSAAVIAPDRFNLAAGLGNMLKMMGACFAINGILTVMAYFKQSPLPPDSPDEDENTSKPPAV